jgi:hypothetical protein
VLSEIVVSNVFVEVWRTFVPSTHASIAVTDVPPSAYISTGELTVAPAFGSHTAIPSDALGRGHTVDCAVAAQQIPRMMQIRVTGK